MAVKLKVRNPQTKKVEIHSPNNARDMQQHLGWKIVGTVDDKTPDMDHDPQAIMNMKANAATRVDTNASKQDDGDEDVD